MPEAWKNMTGAAARRSDTAPSVAFTPGAPTCPDHLDAEARTEWHRIVPELITAGLLCTVDTAALAMYCVAYSRWIKIEERIAFQAVHELGSEGIVTSSKNGFDQLSMWYVASNQQQDRLHKMLTEFGLSPSARARVKAMAVQGDLFVNDALAAFQRAAPGKTAA